MNAEIHGAEIEQTPEKHGYSAKDKQYINRLKRIEGQVRGLQRMIEEGQYCIDILTQASAVTKAIERVSFALLEDHLHHCVGEATAKGGEVAQKKIDEVTAAVARFMR